MSRIRNLLRDQKGTSAIEYGLLASLISLATIAALHDVGNELSNTFNTVEAAMDRHDGGLGRPGT